MEELVLGPFFWECPPHSGPLGLYPALISLSILNPILCTLLCSHPRPYTTHNRGCKLLLVLGPLFLECPHPRSYPTCKDLCQCFQCRVKPDGEGFTGGIKALWGRAVCRPTGLDPLGLYPIFILIPSQGKCKIIYTYPPQHLCIVFWYSIFRRSWLSTLIPG